MNAGISLKKFGGRIWVACDAPRKSDWTQEYAYDRYGNKTGVTKTGVDLYNNSVPADGLPSVSVDSATNRMTTASGWLYDLTGNLIRGQNASGVWQRFEYDAAGRLVKIKNDSNTVLETYTYGASRERLITTTSTQRTYYAWGGSSVMCEYTEPIASSTPAYAKSYQYAGSRLLSTSTKASSTTETTEFHHPDRLGTKLVTNGGTGSWYQQSTLPFGTAFNAESGGYSNQVFTSYDRSAGTGLDYAVNRTYSSGQSRFTQVDPIGMAAASLGNPQSNNLYAYVQNMPTDFVDPSGLNASAVSYMCYDIVSQGHWSNDPSSSVVSTRTVCFFFGGGGGSGAYDSGVGVGGGGGGSSQQNPGPTEAQRKCDQNLASIFGGQGSVAAGSGFEPPKMPGREDSFRGGPGGHLNSSMHLYGSENGYGEGGVYIPAGGRYIGRNPYSSEDSYMFYYSRLGNARNVTLVTSHVDNFSAPRGTTTGRTRIGDIGGAGGRSPDDPNNRFNKGPYIHAHLSIRQGRGYTNRTLSFFDVFCK